MELTMASLTFFDYISGDAKDEIKTSCQRSHSEKLNQFGSLKGRAICILRIGTHAASIILKPLVYIAILIFAKLMPVILKLVPKDKYQEAFKEKADDFKVILATPALMENIQRDAMKVAGCILVAPISQTIQLTKAFLGILHPGIYFKDNKLIPHLKELSDVAKKTNCSPKLVDSLRNGAPIIHKSFTGARGNLRDHYYALIEKDLAVICEKFRDPELTDEHKQTLLTLLNPEPKGNGIEACPPALSRILQQICANLSVPADQSQVMPWLIAQFKREVIDTMVLIASTTASIDNPLRPKWHTTVLETAHEPAHRGNAMVLMLGEQIGLPQEMMDQAKQDPMAEKNKEILEDDVEELVEIFNEFCTEEEMTAYLMAKINSQPDGRRGLKIFRDYMIQKLSEKIADSNPDLEDPASEAAKKYYLNGGVGDPSEEGFTDINEDCIKDFFEDTLSVAIE